MPAPQIGWAEVFDLIEPEAFEELALLAAEICGTPISLVTLVDEQRHWFTSVRGTPAPSTRFEETFCAHAVRELDVFVVGDAAADQRFEHSPLVVFEPHVRFYAGAPLVSSGGVLGTLCVMDVVPRTLSESTVAGLRALSHQVVMQLELRRQANELSRMTIELSQQQEAIRRAQTQLRRVDRIRRELVASVSHDLRTPLTSLRGYLETLQLKGDDLDADDRRRYLSTASRHSERLATLVSDLFDLAHLDYVEVPVRAQEFSVAELAQDVVQSFELRARELDIVLSFHSDRLPATVVADVRLMERVIENLLDNALRVVAAHGHIAVACHSTDAGVTVSVTDSGPGESLASLHQASAEPARRSHIRRGRGTMGLGLAIASRLIERHHARLHVKRVGTGTALSFILPVRVDTAVAPETRCATS